MSKKMLIDATHPEETRVVVVDGNRVDDFDFESINKRQLAGNIYLAKVTRVEPSLQAAFVDYGGNRHGFLAFPEIHPDYYQIPVADREALLAEEAAEEEAARKADESRNGRTEEAPKAKKRRPRRSRRDDEQPASAGSGEAKPARSVRGLEVIEPEGDDDDDRSPAAEVSGLEVRDHGEETGEDAGAEQPEGEAPDRSGPRTMSESTGLREESVSEELPAEAERESAGEQDAEATPATAEGDEGAPPAGQARRGRRRKGQERKDEPAGREPEAAGDAEPAAEKAEVVDEVGADDLAEEVAEIRRARRRRYKIQDVIKVRQIMLVQVVKEERGNKGAALTTYLSLAGRYCVLMPNTARGGGISRKITQAADRKRLRDVVAEFEVPAGMGLIVRTAGAERTRAEIKRDYEYLLRQWEQIRELTLKSIAPTLIYEEASLIKRAIRDLYSKDIDTVLVEGDTGYREAKDYMKMLMPSHARHVQQYAEQIPLFIRYQVESYLNAMFNPTVQLKSGGYIVIGVTEALVAIDVNSGRSTREGSVEETALKTNLEAADEVARQLRLRDLAGLIVIDFIDMDEARNNRAVEKRVKDRLKTDRARIQVGRISAFGLMEMSRQRLRPGMLEATTQPCPHCHGQGIVRSDESLALSILRELEEEGVRGRSAEVTLAAPVDIVNFLVNHKRGHLSRIEERYGLVILLEGTPTLTSPNYTIERSRTASRPSLTSAETVVTAESAAEVEAEEDETAEAGAPREAESARETERDDGERPGAEGARRRRGKRGGRRRRGRGEPEREREESAEAAAAPEEEAAADGGDEGEGRSRRRRRRGKRREDQPGERAEPRAAAGEDERAREAEEAPAGAAETEAAPAAEPAAAAVEETAPETAAEEEPAYDPDFAAEAVDEITAEVQPEPTPEPALEIKSAAPAEEPMAEPATEAQGADGDSASRDDRSDAEPTPEPEAAEPEPEAAEPEPEESARPKRRGWWSLGSFR